MEGFAFIFGLKCHRIRYCFFGKRFNSIKGILITVSFIKQTLKQKLDEIS